MTEFQVLIGAVVQVLIHVQLVGVIAILTHTALEVLHVAATIAKQIFRHLEVIGQVPLIVVKVRKIIIFSGCSVFYKVFSWPTKDLNNID